MGLFFFLNSFWDVRLFKIIFLSILMQACFYLESYYGSFCLKLHSGIAKQSADNVKMKSAAVRRLLDAIPPVDYLLT